MNHPAVVKAAQRIASSQKMGYERGLELRQEAIETIIERETKYSRLVEAATKVLRSEFSSNHREWREVIAQLRSVLAEIKEG